MGYVSSELTHFVGRGRDEEAAYGVLKKILTEGCLRSPRPTSAISPGENGRWEFFTVCFCDIPFDQLGIHVGKYGSFGIAFPKALAVSLGANPVFYVAAQSRTHAYAVEGPSNCERAEYFKRVLELEARLAPKLQLSLAAMDLAGGVVGRSQDSSDHQEFTMAFASYVACYLKFFDANLPADHPNNFYMEREWRVLGELPFTPQDVNYIIVPERFQERASEELQPSTIRTIPSLT